jgi:hypothetical protein
MSINKKVIITVAIGLALGAASCRKFLNVNQNPNVSATATVQTLLPAAELYVASTVGVDLEINGSFWAQYWTQDPGASQYRVLDQYAPNPDYFSTPWTNLYAAAENFKQLYALADTLHKKQYMAIALVMKAYTFQLITDAWGNAPYTQALNGQFADSNITSPKYDSQRVIYNGILVNIDSALSLMNTADAAAPGSDDLVYGGNMAKWEKFAYTLKLRIYMRMSAVDPVTAQAGITKLYNTAGLAFIGNGDDASIGFGYSTTNKSPLYAEESSTALSGIQNLVGSSTCIDSMNSNYDPRAYLFYEATSASGGQSVTGLAQGDYGSTTLSTGFSIPSIYVAGDANNTASTNAPVNLLTSWESYFLQAEVVAKGWEGASSGKSDDSLFYYGIQANFNFPFYVTGFAAAYGAPAGGISIYNDYMTGQLSGVPGTSPYWTVYPTTGTFAQKQRFIITQKWFAMCGNQGFEAWCEQRRTGYPDFLVVSKHGTAGTIPKRFLYPTSESTRNANFPGEVLLNVKTWWDLF